MFDETAIRAHFSAAAGRYDAHAELQRVVRAQCMDYAQAAWPVDAKVLDLGCGTGALADEAGRKGMGWRIVGADLSHGMCKKAAEKGGCALQADAAHLPFADHAFGGVFSSLMLQWANAPLHVLREIERVLKPGGRCMLATFVHDTLHELRAAFAAVDDAPHVSEFKSAYELSLLASHTGLLVTMAQEEEYVQMVPGALALMRALKAIGASNTDTKRKRGMMTPGQLRRVEQEYRRAFGRKKEVPVTWRVFYLMLEKRGA